MKYNIKKLPKVIVQIKVLFKSKWETGHNDSGKKMATIISTIKHLFRDVTHKKRYFNSLKNLLKCQLMSHEKENGRDGIKYRWLAKVTMLMLCHFYLPRFIFMI